MAPKQRKSREEERLRKRPKIDKRFQGIYEAIEQADLPSTSTQMLIAGIPTLAVKPSDRHEVQVRIIRMIEEVMDLVRSKLERDVSMAEEKVAELVASKEKHEVKVRAASEAMTISALMSETKAFARCESSEKVKAAEEMIKEKRKLQREAEGAHAMAKDSKEKFASAVKEHFRPLVEWTCGAEHAPYHQTALLPLLLGVGVNDACLACARRGFLRPPGDRSPGDTSALQEVGRALDSTIQLLTSAMLEATSKVELAEAGADAAAASLDAAKSMCVAAVDEGMQASYREKDARDEALAAQVELDAFAPKWTAVTAARSRAQTALLRYTEYNLSCLKTLKEQGVEGGDEVKPGEGVPNDASAQ